MKNKDIKDLTKKDVQTSIDEVSPQELDQIAGGVKIDDAEDEECGAFVCGTYSEKMN